MNSETMVRNPPTGDLAPFTGVASGLAEWSLPSSDPPLPRAMTPAYRGSRLIRRRHKSWSCASACVAEMRCDGPLHVDLTGELPMLSAVLDEVGGRFEIRSNSCRDRAPSNTDANRLSLIPARHEAHGYASGMRYIRHLLLRFDGAALARAHDDEIDLSIALAPRLMFADRGIMHLAELFAAECANDGAPSRLYGDTLSMALLLALSRLGGSRHRPGTGGQLAPWQLRRVTEYFAAHLAEDIQLQTVADLVRLSRSYFSRAFKISTGVAPHRWLLQARIGKAKELLLEGDLSLARIAVDIGFADQAHFTRTFGRAVGESPRAWQRDRCG
jgi:AraC family transcriptional regulator